MSPGIVPRGRPWPGSIAQQKNTAEQLRLDMLALVDEIRRERARVLAGWGGTGDTARILREAADAIEVLLPAEHLRNRGQA